MRKEYIPRPYYIARIKPFMRKDIIKVLVGQRRTGKSYLLYQLMDEIKKEDPGAAVIYINKEEYAFRDILTWEDLYRYVTRESVNAGYCYLFIDEIQEIKEFERALRTLLYENRYDIYCTGSNARMLSGDLATLLSGRYVEQRVYSLSYPEFLRFHGYENSNDTFIRYMRFGGMPWLAKTGLDEEAAYEYLHNLYNTIILKDVVERFRVRNVAILKNLILFLAGNAGSIISAKKISEYLKSQRTDISVKVVIEYLAHLADAMLVSQVRRTDIEGKRVFEIGEKYYFGDTGIRNSLVPFRQDDTGKLLENIVFNHLRFAGYDVTAGSTGEREIDFVAERAGKKVYVQVAYLIPDGKTHDREFGNLLAVKDNWPKYVVSMDEISGGITEGVVHLNIKDFLLRTEL